ncbi:MAG: helix-turn-helix domain-containing protein [Actinomycetota bacterium]|nr:helix-turn-helix domain-containing protein [Actinomycetota bacterium]
MPSQGNCEYITVKDAAELLGVSPGTLHRWARQGRVRSELKDDGTRLLLKAEVVRIAVPRDERPPPG